MIQKSIPKKLGINIKIYIKLGCSKDLKLTTENKFKK